MLWSGLLGRLERLGRAGVAGAAVSVGAAGGEVCVGAAGGAGDGGGGAVYVIVWKGHNLMHIMGPDGAKAEEIAGRVGVPYTVYFEDRALHVNLRWHSYHVGFVGFNALFIGKPASEFAQRMTGVDTIDPEDFEPKVVELDSDGGLLVSVVGDNPFHTLFPDRSSWPVVVGRESRGEEHVTAFAWDGERFHDVEFPGTDGESVIDASFSPAGWAVWVDRAAGKARFGRMRDEESPVLTSLDRSVRLGEGLPPDFRIAWLNDSVVLLSSGHMVHFDASGVRIELVAAEGVPLIRHSPSGAPVIRKIQIEGRDRWQHAELVDGRVEWVTLLGLPGELRVVRGLRGGLVMCIYKPWLQHFFSGGNNAGRVYRMGKGGQLEPIDREIGLSPQIYGVFVLERP